MQLVEPLHWHDRAYPEIDSIGSKLPSNPAGQSADSQLVGASGLFEEKALVAMVLVQKERLGSPAQVQADAAVANHHKDMEAEDHRRAADVEVLHSHSKSRKHKRNLYSKTFQLVP